MKIVVRNKESRPHHLVLFLPLWAVKLKVVSKALSKYNVSITVDEFHQEIKDAYKIIKQYVRKNGHFDLVKVDTHDGTHVQIRI